MRPHHRGPPLARVLKSRVQNQTKASDSLSVEHDDIFGTRKSSRPLLLAADSD
jgi:hypothetical protein